MNSYVKGRLAEFLACAYMRLHGWKIVRHNYKTGRGTTAGEIDFIAVRGKVLAFVEVKKRGTLDKASYAISLKQRRRLIRGASHFLQQNPAFHGFDMRFDAVLISSWFCVRHISGAWQADL